MMLKKRPILRVLSLTLALSLVWFDTVWALDPRQKLIEDQLALAALGDGRREGSPDLPELSTASEGQALDAVSHQDTLQDLMASNAGVVSTPSITDGFTLKSQTNDLLQYSQGKLAQITTSGGDVLKNINLSQDGAITDAEIHFSDGSIQILENAQVVGYRQPDGTRILYRDGKIEKMILPNNEVIIYIHGENTLTAESPRMRAVYSKDGQLLNLVNLVSGSLTSFDSGVIASTTVSDGRTILYDRESLSGGSIRVFAQNVPQDLRDQLPFLEAVYDSASAPVEIQAFDGSKLRFANGRIASATDASGQEASFDINLSSLGNVLSATIVQNGLKSSYDASGALSAVDTGELVIHYKNSSIDHLETKEGDILDSLAFDADGLLKDVRVIERDGGIKTYKDKALLNYLSSDGTLHTFKDGHLQSFVTKDKIVYSLDHSGEAVIATIDPSFIPDLATPVRMEYDDQMKLKVLARQNGEITRFLADDEIEVNQGATVTRFDASGNPAETVIKATSDNPHEIRTLYKYGKIREVYKDGAKTLEYSYGLDAQGTEEVQIRDLASGTLKHYKNGLLLTSLEEASSVLSTYAYDAENRVSETVLTRLGRHLARYVYSYEADNTLVTDEEGIVRTFDKANKLIFLKKKGELLEYRYFAGQAGEEIIEERRVPAEDESLSPDTVIVKEYSENGTLQTQTTAGGSVTIFGPNGKPEAVLDDKGNTLVTYSYDEAGNLEKVFLKEAREKLPREVESAESQIEAERAASLRQLAESKRLAIDEIKFQTDSVRSQAQGQLSSLQAGYSSLEGTKMHGSKAKKAKSEALDQYRATISQAQSQLNEINRQEAEAYAALDNEVAQVSNRIASESDKAVESLRAQEEILKKEIIRQEVSPVIYDAYRRILGRDPSNAEYESWVKRTDYESTQVSTAHVQGASLDFKGGIVQMEKRSTLTMAAADFTFETFLNFNSNETPTFTVMSHGVSASQYMMLDYANGNWRFVIVSGGQKVFEMIAPDQTQGEGWHHLALVHEGQKYRIYRDGELKAQGSSTWGPAAAYSYQEHMVLGGRYIGGIDYGNRFRGQMDGVRITRSKALYNENFVPDGKIEPQGAILNIVKNSAGHLSDISKYNHQLLMMGDVSEKADESATYYEVAAAARSLRVAVENELLESHELKSRSAFVTGVKNLVSSELEKYLTLSDSGRLDYALTLNLTPDELVPVSPADAQKILQWIQGGSLHFGQSAFDALKELLRSNKSGYEPVELAGRSILIDILAGVITPLDEGDLIISAYALQKTASLYGLDTKSLSVTWDALKDFYAPTHVDILERDKVSYTNGTSLHFKNESDYLTVDRSSDFEFDGDFTVEFSVLWGEILSGRKRVFDSGGLAISLGMNNLEVAVNQRDRAFTYASPSSVGTFYNKFVHFAVTRKNGVLRTFVNGQKVGEAAYAKKISSGDSRPVMIGKFDTGYNGYPYSGGIIFDQIRISKGISRYEANFAALKYRYDPDKFTTLLISPSKYGSGVPAVDESGSGHTLKVSGTVSVSRSYQLMTKVVTKEKYLARSGIEIAGLSYSQKQALFLDPTRNNPKAIVHLNGNHYSVLVDVSDTTVTYIDTGAGAEGNHQKITVSKEEFLKAWNGFLMVDTARADQILANAGAEEVSARPAKELSAQEAQRVRGAFFGNILSILGTVFFFIPGFQPLGLVLQGISAAVSAIEGDFISAISSLVTLGMGAFGEAIKGALQGVTSALTQVGGFLKGAVEFIAKPITGFLSVATKGLSGMVGSIPGLSAKITDLAKFAISTGVKFGVSRGLEALNLPAPIVGYITAFTSGALLSPASALQSGLGALGSFGSILPNAVLPGGFSGITSLLVNPIAGILQLPVSGAVTQIATSLMGQAINLGVNKLAYSTGLSAGTLGSIVNIGGTFLGGLLNPTAAGTDFARKINESLLSGALSVGVNYAASQITDNPLLKSLTSTALAGSIEGFLSPTGVFSTFGKLAKEFVYNTATSIFTNTGALSSLIQKDGLAKALEAVAVGAFDRTTIESVVRSGGMAQVLLQQPTTTRLPSGEVIREISLGNGEGVVLDASGKLVGLKRQGVYQMGEFTYTSDGNLFVKQGDLYTEGWDGEGYYHIRVDGSRVLENEYIPLNTDGTTPIRIVVDQPEAGGVVFDDWGMPKNGRIEVGDNQWTYKNGDVISGSMPASGILDPAVIQSILNDFGIAKDPLDIRLNYDKTANGGYNFSFEGILKNIQATGDLFKAAVDKIIQGVQSYQYQADAVRWDDLLEFIDEKQISYQRPPQLLYPDEPQITSGTPTQYIIDPNGGFAWQDVGGAYMIDTGEYFVSTALDFAETFGDGQPKEPGIGPDALILGNGQKLAVAQGAVILKEVAAVLSIAKKVLTGWKTEYDIHGNPTVPTSVFTIKVQKLGNAESYRYWIEGYVLEWDSEGNTHPRKVALKWEDAKKIMDKVAIAGD